MTGEPARAGRHRRRTPAAPFVLGAVLVIIGALGAGYVLWTGYGPRPEQVKGQVAHLDAVIADDGDVEMQQLFPEGRFFTQVLTGLAEIETARAAPTAERKALIARSRSRLAVLDSPALLAPFGDGMEVDSGVFALGWRLDLAVRIAEVSDDPADRATVADRSRLLAAAVSSSPTPFLAGYPGQYWPCDTVVAMSALFRANRLLGLGLDELLTAWLARSAIGRDPATGLLAHRVDEAGRPIEGARGSSQSIIQTFWPGLDPTGAPASWAGFRENFVIQRLGLVGVAEYPAGSDGVGDVDSGPLIAGVSLSASTVGLAAARANGDVGLADQLDREADLLGVRWSVAGRTSYAAGQLPVGDAFLAWARSRPIGPESAPTSPRAVWWGLAAPGVVMTILGVAVVGRAAGRRRRPTCATGVPPA